MKNNFALISPLVPIGIKWLQTEFSMFNFGKWSLDFSVLCKNCSTDCLFCNQNPPFVDLQTCCLRFTQNVLQKGIWLLVTETWVNAMYVLVNWKTYFAWRCGIRCDKTMSVVFTQNLFIKVKVVWNKSKRSLVISGLTCWVCLKAFKRSQKDQEWWQPSNIANAKHFQQAVNKNNIDNILCASNFYIQLFSNFEATIFALPSQILLFSIHASFFDSQFLKVFELQWHDLCLQSFLLLAIGKNLSLPCLEVLDVNFVIASLSFFVAFFVLLGEIKYMQQWIPLPSC